MALLKGEDATVLRPSVVYDERRDEVVEWAEEPVSNVLFGRPSTEAAAEAMRAHGVRAAYVLGVPKSYAAPLAGCRVRRELDGAVFDVAGDPLPLPEGLCPTAWNREAVVVRSDG